MIELEHVIRQKIVFINLFPLQHFVKSTTANSNINKRVQVPSIFRELGQTCSSISKSYDNLSSHPALVRKLIPPAPGLKTQTGSAGRNTPWKTFIFCLSCICSKPSKTVSSLLTYIARVNLDPRRLNYLSR